MKDLAPLLEVVDKVIVVTIPSSVDRQRDVAALLGEMGLPFEFHYGFDARASTRSKLEADGLYCSIPRKSEGKVDLTPGEIGCSISHRQIAEKLLNGSDQRFLILEDDAIPTPSALARLPGTIRSMPRDWNLAYFAYSDLNLHVPRRLRVKLLAPAIVANALGLDRAELIARRRMYRRGLHPYWMTAGWHYLALAYAIDREAASYVVESQTPITYESDVALSRLVVNSGLRAICARHRIFEQRPGIKSTIGARPWWNEFKMEAHP